MLLELAYLRSYEHMGVAVLRCQSGCECDELQIDAHQEERSSQVHLQTLFASQSARCVLSLTVAGNSSSGEHKFKVTGLIVSEQSGTQHSVQAAGAVEYVGDIAARSAAGKFDVLNHVRRRARRRSS